MRDRMNTFEVKDGEHKGELVIVIDKLGDNVNKCLTLGGDIHYYTNDGIELNLPVKRRGLLDYIN